LQGLTWITISGMHTLEEQVVGNKITLRLMEIFPNPI
jgi:hypothetical protein